MSKNKTYRRFIRMPDGRRLTQRFSRSADADRWYFEMKRRKELEASGLAPQLALVAFGDFADEWLVQRKLNYPKSTWRQDEARLRNYISPVMANRPMQRIPCTDWEKLLNSLVTQFKLASSTRNRVRTLVGKIYSDAMKRDVVAANPISRVPKLKEMSKAWSSLSHEESIRYLEAASREESYFYAIAMIALNTGIRIGESLALSWADIRFETRQMHIFKTFEMASWSIQERTKGGGGRWLGINDSLFTCLKKYKVIAGRSKNLFIDNPICGEIDEHSIRKIHWRVCEKAKIKKIRIHDLRHTYASLFMMQGGSQYDLKEILGHADLQTTERYSHLKPGHLESKANLVSLSPTFKEGKVIEFPYNRESSGTKVAPDEENQNESKSENAV